MQSIMLMLISVLMFLMPCSLYSQSKSEESLKNESYDDAHLTVIYTSDLQQRLIESFEAGFGLSELSAVIEYVRKRALSSGAWFESSIEIQAFAEEMGLV